MAIEKIIKEIVICDVCGEKFELYDENNPYHATRMIIHMNKDSLRPRVKPQYLLNITLSDPGIGDLEGKCCCSIDCMYDVINGYRNRIVTIKPSMNKDNKKYINIRELDKKLLSKE